MTDALTADLKQILDMMHFVKQNKVEGDIEEAEFDIVMRYLQAKASALIKLMGEST